jgi:drug/metabolite transporter (DMT)-like permease
MAALGIVGFGLYQVLWMTALETIPAGDSSLLIATTPVLTALLAVVAGTDTLTPAKLVGALVAFAGVALIVGEGGLSLGSSLLGDVLTLGAALCWAIYTAWGARILRRYSPLRTTTWNILFGTLVLLPLGIVQLAGVADPGPAILATVPMILYSGILSAGLPNVVVFHGVKLLGPSRVTAYQFLVPALTLVVAALVLAEPIRAVQVVGGVVIVAGVLMTRRDRVVPLAIRRRVSSPA